MEASFGQASAEQSRPPVFQVLPGGSYLARLAEEVELLRVLLGGCEVPGRERGNKLIAQAIQSLIEEREAELDSQLDLLTEPPTAA